VSNDQSQSQSQIRTQLSSPSRRRFLQSTAAASTITGLAGCITGSSSGSRANSLTFMQWSGEFGETAERVLKEPFEEEFDVTINQVPLPSPSDMLSKLQAGSADFDLVSHWDYTLYRGVQTISFRRSRSVKSRTFAIGFEISSIRRRCSMIQEANRIMLHTQSVDGG